MNTPELTWESRQTRYSNTVKTYRDDGLWLAVRFKINQGCLSSSVKTHKTDTLLNEINLDMGKFSSDEGAKLFAQFAVSHFDKTENWDVCPNLKVISIY
jgi:hypothetical protein